MRGAGATSSKVKLAAPPAVRTALTAPSKPSAGVAARSPSKVRVSKIESKVSRASPKRRIASGSPKARVANPGSPMSPRRRLAAAQAADQHFQARPPPSTSGGGPPSGQAVVAQMVAAARRGAPADRRRAALLEGIRALQTALAQCEELAAKSEPKPTAKEASAGSHPPTLPAPLIPPANPQTNGGASGGLLKTKQTQQQQQEEKKGRARKLGLTGDTGPGTLAWLQQQLHSCGAGDTAGDSGGGSVREHFFSHLEAQRGYYISFKGFSRGLSHVGIDVDTAACRKIFRALQACGNERLTATALRAWLDQNASVSSGSSVGTAVPIGNQEVQRSGPETEEVTLSPPPEEEQHLPPQPQQQPPQPRPPAAAAAFAAAAAGKEAAAWSDQALKALISAKLVDRLARVALV